MHWLSATSGGMLIGAASALLLLTHGRIAGISGIVGRLVQRETNDDGRWRLAFVGGLLAAGAIAAAVAPATLGAPTKSAITVVIAGLLVGYGTHLARGCTSGHGVCGVSRRSGRSLVAVTTFMTTAAITATISGVVG